MRSFLIATTFLTRIPLPYPDNVSKEEFTKSQKYYPLVGLLIGLTLWLAVKGYTLIFPTLVSGALILFTSIFITGGLHLDGFMDSMDALLSARDRDKMLLIMKDSRVGAHASISLFMLLILKFSLIVQLIANPNVLIFMPIISRWVLLLGIKKFPYIRENGLGDGFNTSSNWLVFSSYGIGIIALVIPFLGLAGFLSVLGATSFTIIFCKRITSLLGGLTGDIYGAIVELAEVVFLLIFIGLI